MCHLIDDTAFMVRRYAMIKPQFSYTFTLNTKIFTNTSNTIKNDSHKTQNSPNSVEFRTGKLNWLPDWQVASRHLMFYLCNRPTDPFLFSSALNQMTRLLFSVGNLYLADVCEDPTGFFGSRLLKYIRLTSYQHSYCRCKA